MGCLIALTMAIKYPELVEKLVLIGPPPSPVPEAGRNGSIARAATVRSSGMSAVVDAVVTAGTSAKSKTDNLVALAAIRMSLLGQDPEGYAKGCTALAGASDSVVVSHVKARTLIITGDEDKVSPPQICEKYTEEIKGSKLVVLPQVGHWHVMEDLNGVSSAVGPFLQ
jgi:pimeloyl-ACP methyl ester carboxylesterase